MKRFSFLFIIALTLVSCMDEYSLGVKLSSNALVFDVAQMRVANGTETKAGPVSGETFPTDLSMCLTSYSSTTGSTFFNDIPFTYNSEAGGWKATTGKYWPQTGTLDFIAYSCPGLTPTVTYATPNATTGITSFVTGDNRTVQADLMFGGAENCSYSPSSKPTFSFKHALSLVTFTAACPDVAYDSSTNTGVTIESITLATANYGGTCAVSRSGNTISGISWTSLANNYNGNPVPGISSQGLTTAQVPVGAGVLLPPQNAVNFTINYTVHSGPGVNSSKSYTYSNSGTWTMANRYVYAIEISIGNEVVVSAQVTDWTSPAMNWFYAEGKRIVHQGTDFTLASGQPVYWRNSSKDGYEKLTYVSGSYGSSVRYEATTHYVTVTRVSDYYSISLERKFSTFAGIMIAPAPLYYNGTNFEIRDNDDWKSTSYNVAHGKVAGSYLFSRTELGQYFDSRGSSYTAPTSSSPNSGPINNFGNKISFDRYDDWRMMRPDEWLAIIGFEREGATVNGYPNIHYCYVGVMDYRGEGKEAVIQGYLLFPDGYTISAGTYYNELIFDQTGVNNYMTLDQLDECVRQGCVYIPEKGTYYPPYSQWRSCTDGWDCHLTGCGNDGFMSFLSAWDYKGTFGSSANDVEAQTWLVRGPYQQEYASFGGLYISRAPLFNHSSGFYVVNDHWNYSTPDDYYNRHKYYHPYSTLGKFFSSQGNSFPASNFPEIDNQGQRVSLDGISNWRLPTGEEWNLIIGTSRQGSTVNGTSGVHYAMVMTNWSFIVDNARGMLLFPDGKTMNGKTLNSYDSISYTSMTWEELNGYISQGCVFLPNTGYYQQNSSTNWSWNGNGSAYYRSCSLVNAGSWNAKTPSLYFWPGSTAPKVQDLATYMNIMARLVSPSLELRVTLTDGDGVIVNKAYAVTRTGTNDVSSQCSWSINSEGKVQASYSYGGQTYTASVMPSPANVRLQAAFTTSPCYGASVTEGTETVNIGLNREAWLVYPLATGSISSRNTMRLETSSPYCAEIVANASISTIDEGIATISASAACGTIPNSITLNVSNLSFSFDMRAYIYDVWNYDASYCCCDNDWSPLNYSMGTTADFDESEEDYSSNLIFGLVMTCRDDYGNVIFKHAYSTPANLTLQLREVYDYDDGGEWHNWDWRGFYCSTPSYDQTGSDYGVLKKLISEIWLPGSGWGSYYRQAYVRALVDLNGQLIGSSEVKITDNSW